MDEEDKDIWNREGDDTDAEEKNDDRGHGEVEDVGELLEDHFPGNPAVGAAPADVPAPPPAGPGGAANCIGEIGKNGKKLNFRKWKKLCTYSTKGCPQPSCQEHICPSFWAKGYDKYKKRK